MVEHLSKKEVFTLTKITLEKSVKVLLNDILQSPYNATVKMQSEYYIFTALVLI